MAKAGLFRPPRHRWLAGIITFEAPGKAREAARYLVNALKRGRIRRRRIGRKTALTILRALVYAANRARASAKRENLSRKERHELVQIAEIYHRAALKASRIYHEKYTKQ